MRAGFARIGVVERWVDDVRNPSAPGTAEFDHKSRASSSYH